MKRQFFERWGEELFRQAFSFIPQSSITNNTKAAGLRLRKRIKQIRIILESHDSLLFMVPERHVDDWGPQIKEEVERPIRFDTCSLPRRHLSIPCDLEIGYNYYELNKLKMNKPILQSEIQEPSILELKPKDINEEMKASIHLPDDSDYQWYKEVPE
jgi:hypothetical protein